MYVLRPSSTLLLSIVICTGGNSLSNNRLVPQCDKTGASLKSIAIDYSDGGYSIPFSIDSNPQGTRNIPVQWHGTASISGEMKCESFGHELCQKEVE